MAVFFGDFRTDSAFAATGFVAPARVQISALGDVAPSALTAGGPLIVSRLALMGLRAGAERYLAHIGCYATAGAASSPAPDPAYSPEARVTLA